MAKGGVGVAGIHQARNPDSKRRESGTGIIGATETGSGVGIVGISVGFSYPRPNAGANPCT